MALAKSGQIGNCCAPNALMTLAEYLEDYASHNVKEAGQVMIERLVRDIPSDKIREITERRLAEITGGKRDFRF